ncbi:MAG: hypothetical protein ACFCU2_03345 [Acidimicrobiia bacterium]
MTRSDTSSACGVIVSSLFGSDKSSVVEEIADLLDVAHRRWQRLSPALVGVVLPDRRVAESRDRKVPGWLRHLFWNVDVDKLDVNRDGAFIAGRVLASADAQAHAWAATTLPSDAFLAAASQRGLDRRRAALARNLAAHRGS